MNDEVTEAMDILKSHGFYVDGLWHIDDVLNIFDCTHEEALDILEEAVGGDRAMEFINERIVEYGNINGLTSKEEI